ncbi:MAG TPA: rhodanese-related sulfurtransferase, partial [Candidatus Saccharibacteria bacterium]|nr:rhodanese-related sulfurtransferase [Candidatus Saccharibacteria bacterium]
SIFKKTVYKWSEGSADDFPRLSIKVRPELVAFGAPDAVKVDNSGVIGGGKHLKPEEVNALVAERGDDVIFFDGRNAYEAQIGKFKNTVVPNVRYTRDFLKELDDPKYNDIKDKPIVSYCTGGIRCELLSVHMKNKGFKEVYQIDGGIVKYGETYKDDGLWEGKLYVFDNRMVTGFSKDAKDIGECVHCQGKTSNFENCANVACNDLILICKDCHTTTQTCAKSSCKQTVATKA